MIVVKFETWKLKYCDKVRLMGIKKSSGDTE